MQTHRCNFFGKQRHENVVKKLVQVGLQRMATAPNQCGHCTFQKLFATLLFHDTKTGKVQGNRCRIGLTADFVGSSITAKQEIPRRLSN